MADYEDLAQRYIDTWNETDALARRAAVDQLYSEQPRYVDPMGVAEGRDAIVQMIGAVQQQFPGLTFTLAGPVDAAGHRSGRDKIIGKPEIPQSSPRDDRCGRIKTHGFREYLPCIDELRNMLRVDWLTSRDGIDFMENISLDLRMPSQQIECPRETKRCRFVTGGDEGHEVVDDFFVAHRTSCLGVSG